MSQQQSSAYLNSYLAPLAPFLAQPSITDIYINRPFEVFTESLGGVTERHDAPALSQTSLLRLARQVAALNTQGISREYPLLAGLLPDGSRIQIILPPAAHGETAIAIRRHLSKSLTLEEYSEPAPSATATDAHLNLTSPLASSETISVRSSIRRAVQGRKNILISGGTSSGKTTLLNTLIQEISAEERLITIEDTPEIRVTHSNAVRLVAVRGGRGEADVSAEDLLVASLRMRPDRIILGEMRGSEALTFLKALNTGHPGSMSTIHADSPELALSQVCMLVLQSGINMSWNEASAYIRKSLHCVIQLRRVAGKRIIEKVLFLE
jgi:type IV secretion system protein VirB11